MFRKNTNTDKKENIVRDDRETVRSCIAKMGGPFSFSDLFASCRKAGVDDVGLIKSVLNVQIETEDVLYQYTGRVAKYLDAEMRRLLEAYKLFYNKLYDVNDADAPKKMIAMCYMMDLSDNKLGDFTFSCSESGVGSPEVEDITHRLSFREKAINTFYHGEAYFPSPECLQAYSLSLDLNIREHENLIDWLNVLSSFALWHNALGCSIKNNDAFERVFSSMKEQDYAGRIVWNEEYAHNAYDNLIKADCIH